MSKNIIDKSTNGVLIVKARNGNFNAGFDGNPRTLPDGTIFATDKALKYCVREYLAQFEELPIFVRRNRRLVDKKDKQGNIVSSKLIYQVLEENFFTKLKQLVENLDKVNNSVMDKENKDRISKWVKTNSKNIEIFENDSKNTEPDIRKKFDELLKNDETVMSILKSFIDIRLFGVVFAVKGNVSLTGPVQISYGVNKLQSGSSYPVQILSPYKNPNAKVKEGEQTAQTTIGEETRADEVYYAYNISINSANAKQTEMTDEDLKLFKKSLMNSVDTITSTTKYGCESVALIWLENKKNLVLNNLDEFIDINKTNEGKIQLDLKRLNDYLTNFEFSELTMQKHTLDFDYSKTDENKIAVIYKEGKIEILDISTKSGKLQVDLK